MTKFEVPKEISDRVYQILEVVQQLSGRAGANQVEGARLGMAQNIGGSGSTIITHILGE